MNSYSSYALTSFSGGYIGGVTPVPIPNTEVKPTRADGTPRETARESRSLPDFMPPSTCQNVAGGLLFLPGLDDQAGVGRRKTPRLSRKLLLSSAASCREGARTAKRQRRSGSEASSSLFENWIASPRSTASLAVNSKVLHRNTHRAGASNSKHSREC